MLQKHVLFALATFHVINMVFVLSNRQKRTRNGHRIPTLDDIYIISQLLDSTTTKNKPNCVLSCIDHVDCRAVSYNIMTCECLTYYRDFIGQSFDSTPEPGWRHYQVSFVDYCNIPTSTTAADCYEVQSQGNFCNGIYTINPMTSLPVDVYCDLTTDGGQWTRRFDGSVDFFIYWTDYKIGFGSPSSEHWIGNDFLHQITESGTNELLILMESWDGVWRHARYSDFRIADEGDNYRLHVTGYTGTAGDRLSSQSGYQFSTRDRDNDAWSRRFNDEHHYGGWWFKSCTSSDLNGYYYSSAIVIPNSCHWKARESLKTVWMVVRKY